MNSDRPTAAADRLAAVRTVRTSATAPPADDCDNDDRWTDEFAIDEALELAESLSCSPIRNEEAGVMTFLSRLLGPISADAFLGDFWHKRPFGATAGAEAAAAIVDWPTIDRILSKEDVDLIVGSERGGWQGERPRSAVDARRLAAAGHTLGIRHAERHSERLAALAAAAAQEFASSVDLHVYCTPAGHPGFGWHYDVEDVFMLQAHGVKRWFLRKNTVNPWPTMDAIPVDMQHQREIMPVEEAILHAGQWLYIPAGYWHRGEAVEESISLSVGILSATAVDAFDFARSKLVDSLRWRQRLPVVGMAHSTTTDLSRLRLVFADLAVDPSRLICNPEFAAEFLTARQQLQGRKRSP